MKPRLIFLIIPIFLNFVSCVYDPPPPHISICNQSKEKIKLIVNFNKAALLDFYSYNLVTDHKSYTGDDYNNCVTIIDFDTIKLIGTYLIGSHCKFMMPFDFNEQPHFTFDSLTIVRKLGRVRIKGTLEILKRCKKRRFWQYDLEII